MVNWREVGTANSADQIRAQHAVWNYLRTPVTHHFKCSMYKSNSCKFMLLWEVGSGQLWQSGDHNHGPKVKKPPPAAKSQKPHEQQHQKKATAPHNNGKRQKKQQQQPTTTNWLMKMNLLEAGIADIGDVCSRFNVRPIQQTRFQCLFKCSRCDGEKCGYRLRWAFYEGVIMWNGEPQCQQQQQQPAEAAAFLLQAAINEEGEDQQMEMEIVEQAEGMNLLQGIVNPQQQQQQQEMVQNEQESSDEEVEEIGQFEGKFIPSKSEASVAQHDATVVLLGVDGEEVDELGQQQTASAAPGPSSWRPHLEKQRVKKEEPKDGATTLAAPPDPPAPPPSMANRGPAKPTKMLLRERKKRINYNGM